MKKSANWPPRRLAKNSRMISYIALLPHATALHALVSGVPNAIPGSVTKALDRVASDIHQRGIKTLLIIAGHPRYTRQGFSVYIDKAYSLHFKDFGDLTHQEPIDVSWNLFHRIREAGVDQNVPLHPISDSEPDFSHALPLWLISRQWPAEFKTQVLCVNDFASATPIERVAFGATLATALSGIDEPVAVLVSQECLFGDMADIDRVKEANLQLRYQASSLWSQAEATQITLPQPCAQGAFTIAKSLIGSQPWAYEELCFEHVGNTSILVARVLPTPE